MPGSATPLTAGFTRCTGTGGAAHLANHSPATAGTQPLLPERDHGAGATTVAAPAGATLGNVEPMQAGNTTSGQPLCDMHRSWPPRRLVVYDTLLGACSAQCSVRRSMCPCAS